MGEHRVDQVAARNQPVPGPLPSGSVVDVLEVGRPHHHAAPKPGPGRFRRRMKRRMNHFVKSRRGRWTLAILACIAVLIIGLLAQGFLHDPTPSVGAPVDAGANSLSNGGPSPSAVKSSPATSKGGVVTNPVNYLRSHFPDNPLNHLHLPGLHQVVATASAPGPMMVVGYLIPTGLGSTYGRVPKGRSSWSLSEQAIGRGYLAAIFVQTDKTGVPITCTITIDGKTTSSETTSGAWGRAFCLG